MSYKLYLEDETNYYFTTGRIVGDFYKSRERIGLCKLCGMEYQLPQFHGPINLEDCHPRGIGSTNEVEICTECGQRTNMAITLWRNNEYVAICPRCLEAHHDLDYWTMKYKLLALVLKIWRKKQWK